MKNGTVVKSLQGHDKGSYYIIVGVENDMVLLADGKNKLLKSPKKKNIKHIYITGEVVDLSVYNPLYDAHIRKELLGLIKRGG